METFLSKLFDINKIPTKVIFLFSVVSAILLFIPDDFLIKLNLSEFKNEYGKYFGIIFIVSSAFLIINLVIWLIKKINTYYIKRKYFKKLHKSLNELSTSEQSVLREFFINNQPAIKLPYDNPVVKNLINKRIVVRISDVGEQNAFAGILFPFKINDIIKDKITDGNLGLNPSHSDDEVRHFVHSNRPSWATELDKFEDIFNNFRF